MLKLCRITKLKVFFPVLVYVFNFDLFEFSAAILEKGLLSMSGYVLFFGPPTLTDKVIFKLEIAT